MLTYSFSKIGSESLYMYLYKCIREDILTGKITPGTKLPSKRSFAENLGVSVITVENAYAQLVSEGYVYALTVKKAFFAANLGKKHAPQEKKRVPRTQMPVPPKYFAEFFQQPHRPAEFPVCHMGEAHARDHLGKKRRAYGKRPVRRRVRAKVRHRRAP